MSNFIDTPIEYLKGVGPQRAEFLKKELQVFSFGDLLSFYPFRYVDKTKFYKINEISEDLPYVQVKGKIIHAGMAGERRGRRFTATITDGTGTLDLVWFQGIKWISNRFKSGIEYIVFGKPSLFNKRFNIAHPEIEEFSEENAKNRVALQAVYNTTEKLKSKALDSNGIRKLQRELSPQLNKTTVPESLSDKLLEELKFISRFDALRQIHFPDNAQSLSKAEIRLKFEELFFVQIRLLKSKIFRENTNKGFVFSKVGDFFNEFYKNYLPYTLTKAQMRVIKEIRHDLGSGKQMNRLLQGDVGCGKTLVALMTMLIALDNGYQACIMAPTEILANQHYRTIVDFLQGMTVHIGLLTGSTSASERKILHAALRNGDIQLLIGTHALLEDEVQFRKLGMVVIDEQHRFGVAQRARLWSKSHQPPHVLVMTATPIPRTLAMTLYGDLDTSVIDEMPPGRKQVKTMHYFDSHRLKVFGFMKEQIRLGRQVYVVYPLIKESEKMDYKDLMDGYESISREFPLPDYRISILHGKMKPAEKEFEMNRFIRGQTQIMVATTVIEVGVNIANASVMIVESAERFGLSQLHQLRGRVGRGADQSYCVLMTSYKLSHEGRLRMETMVKTNDGFEISEADLRMRGPGDIAGTQQSGILNLRIADLAKDAQLLQHARKIAGEILQNDPDLQLPENIRIASHLKQVEKEQPNWSKIS